MNYILASLSISPEAPTCQTETLKYEIYEEGSKQILKYERFSRSNDALTVFEMSYCYRISSIQLCATSRNDAFVILRTGDSHNISEACLHKFKHIIWAFKACGAAENILI